MPLKKGQTQHHLSREDILERLLDATSLLLQAQTDHTVLFKSLALAAGVAQAASMWIYQLEKGKTTSLPRFAYGIQRQAEGWQAIQQDEMPACPHVIADASTSFQPLALPPEFRVQAKGWFAAVCSRGILIVDTDREDLLVHLSPYLQALGGFIAREEAEANTTTRCDYLRSIIDNIPAMVFSKDEQGRFVIANQRVAAFYQVASEDLIGKTDADFHRNPKEVERYLEEDQIVIRSQKAHQFTGNKVSTKDGRTIYLDTEKLPLPSPGGDSVHVLGVARDVTQERAIEEREKRSRLQYDNFIKHTTEGIYNICCAPPVPLDLPLEEIIDRFYESAYIRDCNQALAHMYGAERPEGVIGTTIAELHGLGEDNPNRKVVARFFLEGLQVRDLETREHRKDRGQVWFVNHSVGLVEQGCLTDVWGGQIDITAIKQLELDLRDKSKELQLVLESSKVATWYWDISAGKAFYNEYFSQMLGVDPEEVPNTVSAFLDIVHPDGLDTFVQKVDHHLYSDNRDAIFEHEMRLRCKDGSYKWALNRGRVTDWSGSGKPVKARGLLIDITARKQIELALQLQKNMLKLVGEAADISFWEVEFGENVEAELDALSPVIHTYAGLGQIEEAYTYEALLELLHPDDTAMLMRLVKQKVGIERTGFKTEVRIRQKSGEYAWFYDHCEVYEVEGRTRVAGLLLNIDERKKAEEVLQERETVFRSLFEDSPMAILFCDKNGRILQVNENVARLLGYEIEDLLCKSIQEFTEDKSIIDQLNSLNSIGANRVVQSEQHLVKKDGSQLLAKLLFSVLYDGQGQPDRLICSIDDVTERRAAQEALQRSQELRQAILEAMPDLKFLISKEGRFLDYFGSESQHGMLLHSPGGLLGSLADDILPDYLAKALTSNLRKAIVEREVQTFDYPLSVQGQLYYLEARLSAVNEEEAIVVIRNVTTLVQAQQKLRRKLEELDRNNEMLTRYIDSNIQLENFAHTVSHDLREPVRTMNSFSQLLKRKYENQLDQDAKAYLDFIEDSAQHMNHLIEDLLRFARFTNTPEPGFDAVDLQALVENVRSSLRGLIQDKQATVQIINPLPTIQGNPTKLRQLFQNLISNGVKFSQLGVHPEVMIDAYQQGAYWHFSVSDNGIGIDQADHGRIFQLFRRLHSKKRFPGSGIGLTLCKRVVEQHGGEISVQSVPGQGATFTFTLHEHYS